MEDFIPASGDLGHSFEDLAGGDGHAWWYYSDLLRLLGYETNRPGPLKKAMQACLALDIPIHENFDAVSRKTDGRSVQDYRVSRFGCYLIAMNADAKKPQVARAQVYFVRVAETLIHILEASEGVERVLIREEISDRERSIAGVARQHGVVDYRLFQRAGYRGLYNRTLGELRTLKGMTPERARKSLLDFMGKDELAANLFRITLTEAKIKNERIFGQEPLEVAAESVGREVRETILRAGGDRPEDLPLSEDIKLVRRKLKGTAKRMREIDKSKK